MTNLINKYQKLVNDTIPISRYMQWQILSLDDQEISTRTQLQPNINVHGTGFAGSVYSAAMATGWTLMKAWNDSNQYENTLLAAEANIKYLSPVYCDFVCHAGIKIPSAEYSKLVARLNQKSSVGFPLTIEVSCENNVCAILEVLFVFKC